MQYQKPHITHPFVPHPKHEFCAICDRKREAHKSEWQEKPKEPEAPAQ